VYLANTKSTSPPAGRAIARIAGLVGILAVASLVAYKLGLFDYRHAADHITRLQRSHSIAEFAFLFVAVYAVATSIGVPAFPFTIAGGVVFGTMLGTSLSLLGAVLGAAIGYWLARTVAHDIVLRWLKRFRRLNVAIDESRHFAGVIRLRLVPVFPLGLVTFAVALAKAPFGRFLLATTIGLLPMTIIYSYFADTLIEGMAGGHRQALTTLAVASTTLIVLSLIPRLMTKRFPPRTRSFM
jgi:uncharacterized membrane protein YdjX (TVP38/TMEM64 family)